MAPAPNPNVVPPVFSLESPSTYPNQFRFYTTNPQQPMAPNGVMSPAGYFTPNGPNGAPAIAVPALLCTNAMATGTGATANLRNRCRRAIDSYGALVVSCNSAPNIVPPQYRAPNAVSPDNMPVAGHAPHVTNVQGLTQNAQMCALPPLAAGQTVPNLNTPANTCPGLLGWFTVVYSACGFTNAPAIQLIPGTAPNVQQYGPNINTYFPYGTTVSPNIWGGGAVTPGTPTSGGAGYFCAPAPAPNTPSSPSVWNINGATVFRTSRCRKALDQFGRTASRCHFSVAPNPQGSPLQAGGYSDPLRLLAVGNVATNAPASPSGFNVWAPACN